MIDEKDVREFYRADFEHFAESYWRNEAVGESRLNIFLGLIATVYGAVGFLGKSNDHVDWQAMRSPAIAASIALLVIGALTLLRVLKRNAATDDFIRAMGLLRKTLTDGKCQHVDHLKTGRTAFSGGTKHVVACINAGLVAILTWVIAPGWVWPVAFSLTVFVAQEVLIRRVEDHYQTQRDKAAQAPHS